jgi:hypothetical protein
LIMLVSLRAPLGPDELGAWAGRSILGQSCYRSIARLAGAPVYAKIPYPGIVRKEYS